MNYGRQGPCVCVCVRAGCRGGGHHPTSNFLHWLHVSNSSSSSPPPETESSENPQVSQNNNRYHDNNKSDNFGMLTHSTSHPFTGYIYARHLRERVEEEHTDTVQHIYTVHQVQVMGVQTF